MYKIYETFLSSTELWQNDQFSFLPNYLNEGGAAVTVIVIALVVALIAVAIFYGIFGMFFPKVGENKWIWLVLLIAAFATTWGVTDAVIIGDPDVPTGVFASIDNDMSETVLPNCGGVQADIDEAYSVQQSMVNELTSGCSFRTLLGLENAGISLLIFVILSICVKNLTKYSRNIPF